MKIKLKNKIEGSCHIKVGPIASEIKFTNDIYGEVFISHTKDGYVINALKVRKNARKKGVGTELIMESENYIFEMGENKAILYANKNKWTHEWYKRMGYTDTNEIIRNKFIKMVKILNIKNTRK